MLSVLRLVFRLLRTTKDGMKPPDSCEIPSQTGIFGQYGIAGVTLHSYRYAWAERAKQCGYPERFAQEALGHNSKAVHRAYARKAQVTLPPLEDYERKPANGKVVKLRFAQTKGAESPNLPAGQVLSS